MKPAKDQAAATLKDFKATAAALLALDVFDDIQPTLDAFMNILLD